MSFWVYLVTLLPSSGQGGINFLDGKEISMLSPPSPFRDSFCAQLRQNRPPDWLDKLLLDWFGEASGDTVTPPNVSTGDLDVRLGQAS